VSQPHYIVKMIKGLTARKLFLKSPQLKRKLQKLKEKHPFLKEVNSQSLQENINISLLF